MALAISLVDKSQPHFDLFVHIVELYQESHIAKRFPNLQSVAVDEQDRPSGLAGRMVLIGGREIPSPSLP